MFWRADHLFDSPHCFWIIIFFFTSVEPNFVSIGLWMLMNLIICLLSPDLLPLDFLSFVLERDTSKLVPGVHMKRAGGVRGVRVSPYNAMSFPSSGLLVNCDIFPEQFSIVVTLKVRASAAKVSIFTQTGLCWGGCTEILYLNKNISKNRRYTIKLMILLHLKLQK